MAPGGGAFFAARFADAVPNVQEDDMTRLLVNKHEKENDLVTTWISDNKKRWQKKEKVIAIGICWLVGGEAGKSMPSILHGPT